MNVNDKEIGGFFGLQQFSNQEYYPELLKLNTGRNALGYLLKARRIKKLYIPYFLCDCISVLCAQYGCEYVYYSIEWDWQPDLSGELPEDAWLYVVNYYGQLDETAVQALKDKYDRVILDNVQAFFQAPVSGVDTVYSCRKFFGVPDGAYLATDTVLAEELPQDISVERMVHVLGRCDQGAAQYYSCFTQSEENLYGLELARMSNLTQNLLRAVNYTAVCEQRNKNYQVLARELDEKNTLQLNMSDGPYCYPFYCAGGAQVRRKLAKKKIYIPTLWPNVLELEDRLARDLAENILPLPCDQRYDTEDMEKLLRELSAALQ